MSTPARNITAAAERLIAAAATRAPCAPVRDLIGAADERAAYAVQQLVVAEHIRNGARRSGRKIGLTSPRVQAQIGVSQPDFGVIFAHSAYTSSARIPFSRLLQPKVEAEVAFVLAKDLVGVSDIAQVRDAIDYAVAAIEIVDSRIAGWDIRLADTVADNASYGAYVLGDTRLKLSDFDPKEVAMRMHLDGKEVSNGKGSDCLGDPLNAVMWLANKSNEVGDPLRAGEVVLSGALGPMAAVLPGSVVEVEITGLGSVSCVFEG